MFSAGPVCKLTRFWQNRRGFPTTMSETCIWIIFPFRRRFSPSEIFKLSKLRQPQKTTLIRLKCGLQFSMEKEKWKKKNKEKSWLPGEYDKKGVVPISHALLLSHKKDDIMPFAATYIGLRDCHTKWNQSDGKTITIWYHLYGEPKMWPEGPYLQHRKRHTDLEKTPMVTKGEG